MRSIFADVRHAGRIYRGVPFESAVAIGALAVAMAGFTALLSLYDSLVRPSDRGFADNEQLVTIGQTEGTAFFGLGDELLQWMNREISGLSSAVGVTRLNATAATEEVAIEFVTDGYFDGLRPNLEMGRGFSPLDHTLNSESIAIVSYEYWRRALGTDPTIIGRSIEIGGIESVDSYRIVGVMGRDVASTYAGPVDFWLPAEPTYSRFSPTRPSLRVFGRLTQGASVRSLRTELLAQYSDSGADMQLLPGYRLRVVPGVVDDIVVQEVAARQVKLLLGGSVLLAIVAGGNASLFLLSQAPKRRRELGIRLAVGAPIRRLVWQVIVEASVFVCVASLIGLVGGLYIDAFLQELPFFRQPQWGNVGIDWRVFVTVVTFSLVLTAFVPVGLVLTVRRLPISESHRLITARASPMQYFFGAVQTALACVFCAAALAFLWHLVLLSRHAGYDVADTFVVIGAPSSGTSALENDLLRRERLRDLLLAQPGIEDVAFASAWPGSGPGFSRLPHPLQPFQTLEFEYVKIDSNFTRLLSMPIVHGRHLTNDDLTEVLVNEAFGETVWGRSNVVGENVELSALTGSAAPSEIVGVLQDASFYHPAREARPTVFVPYAPGRESIIIRSTLPSGTVRSRLNELVNAGALEMEIRDVQSIAALMDSILAEDRARSAITVAAALLVVTLAAFGIYATQTYLVSAGRREYAIRAAVGAGPRALVRLVCMRGVVLGLPGAVVGAILSVFAVEYLRGRFVASSVASVVVSAIVLGIIAAVLMIASVGPLRRTRLIDGSLLSDRS